MKTLHRNALSLTFFDGEMMGKTASVRFFNFKMMPDFDALSLVGIKSTYSLGNCCSICLSYGAIENEYLLNRISAWVKRCPLFIQKHLGSRTFTKYSGEMKDRFWGNSGFNTHQNLHEFAASKESLLPSMIIARRNLDHNLYEQKAGLGDSSVGGQHEIFQAFRGRPFWHRDDKTNEQIWARRVRRLLHFNRALCGED